MNDGATVIGEDLKLDVVRVLDEFLNVNAGVAEGLFSFAAGGVIAFDQGDIVVSDAHPAPAAPGDGLDHYRVTNPLGRGDGFLLFFHHSF